ncbi:MAG TPA: ABC transporter ATP-binding protein [Candidatus Obscuribacterales bacterium]
MSCALKLSCSELTVGFASPVAEKLALCVTQGEVLVIAGPNGAGKSSLLKTFARLLKPMSGSVNLGGRDIWSFTPCEFAKYVAYVPQQFSQSLVLTVKELIALGRNPHQNWWQWQPSKEDEGALEEAIAATGLEGLEEKMLGELSGGERQRAMIAMALAQKPSFLLLDEPTSHLDFKHQLELLELIGSLSKKNIAIIAVLHDLNFAYRVGTRIAILEKRPAQASIIAADGDPECVLTAETLRRVFHVEMQVLTPEDGGKFFNLSRIGK